MPALEYGLGALGGLAQGLTQTERPTRTTIVNPFQRDLMHMMQSQALRGNYGDMGFGRAARQGQSQLAQMMADRGISPTSGVGLAATGNVLANAATADTQNLRNYMMGLTQMSPAVVQTQGWDWTSPSIQPVLKKGDAPVMYDPTKRR